MFGIFILDGVGALLALGGSIIGCIGVCCTGQVVSDIFPIEPFLRMSYTPLPPPPRQTKKTRTKTKKKKLFAVWGVVGSYVAWHVTNSCEVDHTADEWTCKTCHALSCILQLTIRDRWIRKLFAYRPYLLPDKFCNCFFSFFFFFFFIARTGDYSCCCGAFRRGDAANQPRCPGISFVPW